MSTAPSDEQLREAAERFGRLLPKNASAAAARNLLHHLADYVALLREMGVPGDDALTRSRELLERFVALVRDVPDDVDLYRALASEYAHVAHVLSGRREALLAVRYWDPGLALADFIRAEALPAAERVVTEARVREFAQYYALETRSALRARIAAWSPE